MLQVGLGIGSLPKALARSGLTIDVVEIDPEVVRLAREYFDFSANGRVYIEDGRALLGRLPAGSYDIVVHDTFTEEHDAGAPAFFGGHHPDSRCSPTEGPPGSQLSWLPHWRIGSGQLVNHENFAPEFWPRSRFP